MSPEDRHQDAVEAAREWSALQREKYTGGWLSGGCADDAEPGTFLVFEDRPADSTEPPVVREGNVIWVDTGSGSGVEVRAPEGRE